MEKVKKILECTTGVLFILALAVGGLLLFLLPKTDYSEAERRQLALPPERSLEAVANGRSFTQTDEWITDHFEGREFFRHVKAVWQTRVMRETENNGFTVVDGSIVKLEKQVNEDSLEYAAGRFREIYADHLAGTDCRIYISLIPDKSAFLAGRGYPVTDFEEMERLYYSALPEAQAVSIKDALSLEDYYLTDSHWRQERILPAANRLLRAMGKNGALDINGFSEQTFSPFYGVYAAQSALDPKPDGITYLTGGPVSGFTVTDFSAMKAIPVYDPEGCDARDPYTLFIGGSKGLLRIENPNVTDGSELIVFRDSFGSSIAPLLAAEYGSVTLIDTRYIQPALLDRYLRFTDQDVLFLYSVTLMNNSRGMR